MKIRIGNDFKTKWAITWLGEPEDFSDATDIALFFNIYDKKIELIKDVDYTITNNIIEIDCTPDICDILGTYNLELHYTKPNDDFIDGERRSAVDIDAFRIVGKSEKADSTQDVSIISDAVAIFLDIAYKKLEEIEANEVVRITNENEREDAEDIRVANEDIRISNEQDRQINTTTAISNAEQATLNANNSAVYANEQGAYAEEMSSHPPVIIDDYWHIWNFSTNQYETTGQYARGDSAVEGALVVQTTGQSAVNTMSQKAITDDLDLKANHGYTSNPKTLKQVEDDLFKLSLSGGFYPPMEMGGYSGDGVKFHTINRVRMVQEIPSKKIKLSVTDPDWEITLVGFEEDGSFIEILGRYEDSFDIIPYPVVGIVIRRKDNANLTLEEAQNKLLITIDDTKANHGYESNPKTLKEVEDDLVQLLGIIDITGNVGTGFFVASTNGNLVASENSTYTDFIPVFGLKKIYYTGKPYSGSGVVAYDKDKTYITALRSGQSPSTVDYQLEIEIPANVHYIRASSRESDVVVKIMADSVDLTSYTYLNAVYAEPGKRMITEEEGVDLGKIPVLEDEFNNFIMTQLEIRNLYNGIDSQTTLDKTYEIDAVGDFFEIDIDISENPEGFAGLGIIGRNLSSQNSFGYHNTNGLAIREHTGGFKYFGYAFTPGRYLHRVEVTEEGWALFIDGILVNTVTKEDKLELRTIANGYTTSFYLKCNIYGLKIHSSESGSIDVSNMNTLDSYNVLSEFIPKKEDAETQHPKLVIDYKNEGVNGNRQFEVYCKISGDLYSRFRIRHDYNLNDIFYGDYHRIEHGYMYKRVGESFESTNTLLLQIGESEFTMKSPNWVDHTGGAHGDEIKQSAIFFIDGIELTEQQLQNDFIVECSEFSYLQKSTLHETAHRGDHVTNIPSIGEGIISIVGNKYQIDGVDTGVDAYDLNGYKTSVSTESAVDEGGVWKLTGIIIPNLEHPVVANHDKLTVFSEKGYKTRNKVEFITPIYVYAWVGLVCISTLCAETIQTDDFDYIHLDRSGARRIDRKGPKIVSYVSKSNNLSARVLAEFLNSEADDAECNLHVLDSETYAKYYRRTAYHNVEPGEVWRMECDVRFGKATI